MPLRVLLPFAPGGVVLNVSLFDTVYNHGIRHWLKGPRIPRYPMPRRFACLVAPVLVIAAAAGFQSGWIPAGRFIGGSLALAAITGSGIFYFK